MKKRKDANDVIKMIYELPNEKLRNMDKEMSKNLILIRERKKVAQKIELPLKALIALRCMSFMS